MTQPPENPTPEPAAKPKKPWFKKKRVIIPAGGFVGLMVIAGMSGGNTDDTKTEAAKPTTTASAPAASGDAKKDDSKKAEPKKDEGKKKEEPKKEEKVSAEFKNALKKAEVYSNTMHMSKKGIYDQLTSSAGEKFPKDAAKYAVDNVEADWNKNALEKAKVYQNDMSMSKSAIRQQLTSSVGEKFTKAEADYAVKNLDK